MLQPDFSDYLENICRGIKSRPKREEIMEELLCHLEANYERNLAVGMSEDEAKKDAIGKMGDSEILSYRLAAVHSYSPLKEMSSAFITLMIAFVSMKFLLTSTVKEILFLCGIPIMLSPLIRMRKMNATIEKSFHFFNFFVISRFSLYCLGLGRILPFEIEGAVIAAESILQGLFWFLLFTGLHRFCEPYITEERKKPHLYLCGVYHLLMSLFSGFILILSEGEGVTVPSFVMPVFIAFMFFFVIVQLVRMRKILWDADGEYGILPADKKHFRIYAGVLVACAVTVLGFNYLSSTRESVKTELVIHDVTADEQKQADEIRQKMLEWDVDAQIVEDLPDSEVLNYKDAEFVTWGADGGSMGGSTPAFGADSTVWYYWFFIPDKENEGNYDVRLLCHIESNYADSVKGFYRKGFYYMPWENGIFPLNLEDKLNGSFISIVTDENGKKYNAEPFFTYNLADENITTYPKGFEYREEKGQRVYYATQIGVTNFYDRVSLCAATIRQCWFVLFNYKNTADYIGTVMHGSTITVGSTKYHPYKYRLHEIITGNFDDNAFNTDERNSFEYDDGGYPMS